MPSSPFDNLPIVRTGKDASYTERFADFIRAVAGSVAFAIAHAWWFMVWIITNGFNHDPYPYGLLTMIVSLEAIFLSSFILISQNRQDKITSEIAAKDYEYSVVSLKLLLEIADRMEREPKDTSDAVN